MSLIATLILTMPSHALPQTYHNLFAARMCNNHDPIWCPSPSETSDFDLLAFEEMYDDPTTQPGFYPAEPPTATLQMVRTLLWKCETAPDVDPATGRCAADGAEPIRCVDGTRPVFYYDPNYQNPNWYLGLGSAGWGECHESDDAPFSCSVNVVINHDAGFTSLGAPPSKSGSGIMSDSLSVNKFKDFNFAQMERCIGDGYLGRAEVTNAALYASLTPGDRLDVDGDGSYDEAAAVYFHGARMLEAWFHQLDALSEGSDNRLKHADHVLVHNDSYGSYRAPAYIDQIHEVFLNGIEGDETARVVFAPEDYFRASPETEFFTENGVWPTTAANDTNAAYADVLSVVDTQDVSFHQPCKVAPTPGNYAHGLANEEMFDGVGCVRLPWPHAAVVGDPFEPNRVAEWGTVLDASCVAAHPDDPVTSARPFPDPCTDMVHLARLHLEAPTWFTVQRHDPNVRRTPHNDFLDTRYRALGLRGYADRATAWVASIWANNPQHGGFVDNAVDHLALTSQAELRRLMIVDDVAYEHQAFLKGFLTEHATKTFQCMDKGGAYFMEHARQHTWEQANAGVPFTQWPWQNPLTCAKDSDPTDGSQSVGGLGDDHCNDPFGNVAAGAPLRCDAPQP